MFSVITAATDRKLTTKDNVKTELGITGAAEDAKIDRLIDRLSAMVIDYIDVPAAVDGSRTLGLETLEEVFDHSPWFRRRGNRLMLARRPVTEIISITIGAGVTIDPTDYDFDGAMGQVRRTGVVMPPSIGYSPGVRTAVRYKAGWTLPATDGFTLPLPIEGGVIGMIRAARFAADRDPTVKAEWTTDIERVEYWVGQIGENGAFPPDIAAALDPYCYEPEFG